jgi:hypothetical protein
MPEGFQSIAEIICPSCGKANESSPCRRCGCDLSALFAIDRAARIELAAAGKCLRAGNAQDARNHAVRSWRLRHTLATARLAFLTCTALADFASARLWHCRAVSSRF